MAVPDTTDCFFTLLLPSYACRRLTRVLYLPTTGSRPPLLTLPGSLYLPLPCLPPGGVGRYGGGIW